MFGAQERIRATYGHSIEGVVARSPGEPPAELYHGAPVAIVAVILEEGLRPMSRQYVHMAVDVPGAIEVGRRKGGKTALLVVRAREARWRGASRAAAVGHEGWHRRQGWATRAAACPCRRH